MRTLLTAECAHVAGGGAPDVDGTNPDGTPVVDFGNCTEFTVVRFSDGSVGVFTIPNDGSVDGYTGGGVDASLAGKVTGEVVKAVVVDIILKGVEKLTDALGQYNNQENLRNAQNWAASGTWLPVGSGYVNYYHDFN